MGVSNLGLSVFSGRARNTTNSSPFLFAFTHRPHDRSPTSTDFLAKAAEAGPFGGARSGDSGGCRSGFGEGRRAPLHHRARGGEGWRQRRINLPIFSEQGCDPLSARGQRGAATAQTAGAHTGAAQEAAPGAPPTPLPPFQKRERQGGGA